MIELIQEITQIITNYKLLKDKIDFKETETILNLMQNLSCNLFFLEDHLDIERRAFYESYIQYLENYSSTESEKRAKHKHYNKRYLERKIAGGYRVLDTMRSHQSQLKKENNG